MAKKIKFNLGDIFLVPLEENLYGVGRVLKINLATVLVELYYMKPIKDVADFNFDEAKMRKPIVMAWCYDDGLRNGNWRIFGNKPINEEIEMPYFWTQDAANKKYSIRRGTPDSFMTYGEHIEIRKEDIDKYDMFGIGNEISFGRRYVRRLKEAGLL